MKNKKIVLVDMDGVLCDYDMKAALMPQWLKDKHYDCHGIPGFYRDLEPMPGALEAFDWLNEHFDVYICSSPSWRNPSSWIDKRLWVDNVLGEKARKKLILTHNKGLVRGDYLIDDNVWNGVEDFKGEHIHFGTEMNWKSVVEYLSNKENISKVQ